MNPESADAVRDADRWVADPDDMERRRSLAERVARNLSRNECETGLSFFGDDDRARVFSYSPTIVRSLRIRWVFATEGGEAGRQVRDLSTISLAEEGPDIEGVSADLPLGALSLKGSPRRFDKHSGIANTPDDARAVADAFAGDGE